MLFYGILAIRGLNNYYKICFFRLFYGLLGIRGLGNYCAVELDEVIKAIVKEATDYLLMKNITETTMKRIGRHLISFFLLMILLVYRVPGVEAIIIYKMYKSVRLKYSNIHKIPSSRSTQ